MARMHDHHDWLLCLLCIVSGGCGIATPDATPPVGKSPAGASAVTTASTVVAASTFDLSNVEGYQLKVIAITGKPIAGEKARVTTVTDWFVNRRGVLALRAEKSSPGSLVVADLFRIDASRHTARRRRTGRACAAPNSRRRTDRLHSRAEGWRGGRVERTSHCHCRWPACRRRAAEGPSTGASA